MLFVTYSRMRRQRIGMQKVFYELIAVVINRSCYVYSLSLDLPDSEESYQREVFDLT